MEEAGSGREGREEGEEEEGAALAGFEPPPFSLYSRKGFSLREYVVEVLALLAEERGEVTLTDAWVVIRRAARRDKRLSEGLTPRLVLLALKELQRRGYRVRLRIR